MNNKFNLRDMVMLRGGGQGVVVGIHTYQGIGDDDGILVEYRYDILFANGSIWTASESKLSLYFVADYVSPHYFQD